MKTTTPPLGELLDSLADFLEGWTHPFGVVVPQVVHVTCMKFHQSWSTIVLDVGPKIFVCIHLNHSYELTYNQRWISSRVVLLWSGPGRRPRGPWPTLA